MLIHVRAAGVAADGAGAVPASEGSMVRARFAIHLAVIMTTSAMPLPGRAAVLQSIDIDGDTADWSAVLTDPLQTAQDGPSGGLLDLDAPVPSTGRDLMTFAWTYDTTYLYLYVRRVASASNRQRFWFYVDADADGLLRSGDAVLGISWQGANRTTDVTLYAYVAASGAGDPLGDPSGSADGWTMPGSVSALRDLESVQGGSASGVEMEARVAWADLGVPSGAAILFHVASSTGTTLPGQIHDNMGGPGGAVGSTRIPGVALTPSALAGTIVPSGLSCLRHDVANTGEATDVVDLTATSTGSLVPSAIEFHRDADGDGRLGPADPLLADTDGDGRPDTGPLPAGASLPLLVIVRAPATATDGETADVTVRAESSVAPGIASSALDTVLVATPAVTLVKSVSTAEAVPGDVLSYVVSYTSTGSVDAYQVVVVDAVPPPCVYVPGSAAGAGAIVEFSHDGGASFDLSEAAPVTHVRFTLAAPLAPGSGGQVSFRARVP